MHLKITDFLQEFCLNFINFISLLNLITHKNIQQCIRF